MAALIVDLSNHRAIGTEGSGGAIVVEAIEGNVYLTLRSEEALGESIDRTLDSDEARSLAAALVFFAEEVERR